MLSMYIQNVSITEYETNIYLMSIDRHDCYNNRDMVVKKFVLLLNNDEEHNPTPIV